MSGFKLSSVIVSQKDTFVTPSISGDISLVARNGHLQVYDGSNENQLTYTSEALPVVAIISGNTTLLNTQKIVEQTASGITTTLWANPTNNDWVKIRNKMESGSNTINGNGNLIEGTATFTIYFGESFEFRYDGTSWIAF